MSDLKNRLRPSLLDRLTDLHPHDRKQVPNEYTVSEIELKEQVRRDLTWLFSTTQMAADRALDPYPHVKSSVLNFGLRGLTGTLLSSITPEKLKREVQEVIEIHEPRLLPNSLKIDVYADYSRHGRSALVIRIEADLWAEPVPLSLLLRTEIDVETGTVQVEESRT